MRITGDQLGKRFDKNWVFQNLNFDINTGEKWAIIGANGSGKSTLLKIIAGSLSATKGTIIYYSENNSVLQDTIIHKIAFSAPYVELPEEFSLLELLTFHSKFKKPTISIPEMIERIGYPNALNKQLGQYSSGMKQRVRLALNFYFQTTLLALDEPTSNLDEKGINWYQNELKEFGKEKTVIISSNQRYEYEICNKFIQLTL